MTLLDILLLTLEKYIFDTIDCVIDKYDVNCIYKCTGLYLEYKFCTKHHIQ